ncbi:MAG TPA: YqaE/Pmp3 family membrane protein [Bacteroidia bacterium]|nr:YqaE/Pmp3 family membrane protein [Bacteroidia bacterium]
MKKNFIVVIAAVLSVAFITSCSIQKRHYRSGYHVEWKNNPSKNSVNEQEPVNAIVTEQATPVQVENQSAEMNDAVGTDQNQGTHTAVTPAAIRNNVTEQVKSQSEVVKTKTSLKQAVKSEFKKAAKSTTGDTPKGLLIVLCFLLPWLAVGLVTDWNIRVLIINLLWCLTCIGGIIHALIVVNRETK